MTDPVTIQQVDQNTHSVEVFIVNDLGLHARPAAEFVKLSSKFTNSEITVTNEEELEVNGKSIMGLLMLAAAKGTKLTLIAHGPESKQLLESLKSLIESGFGEEITS